MRRIVTCALSALLLCSALLAPVSAAGKYICDVDFENQKVGTAKSADGISMVPLDGELNIVEVEGNKVLEYRREADDGNTAAYTDILTGSKDFEPIHCLQYDIMIPEYLPSAGSWQFATSRQTPQGAGTQFQSTASLNLTNGELQSDNRVVATLEAGKWYTVAAVFNEEKSFYDVYVDGCMVTDAGAYSINTAAKYPERLRVGQAQASGKCVVYVDNVKVYNASVPENVVHPDIEILSAGEVPGEDASSDFELPVWTKQYDVNTIIVSSMGSICIVLVSIFAVVILRRGRSAR